SLCPITAAIDHACILALEEAGFTQASSKCLHQMRGVLGGPSAEIADHRHCRLLRRAQRGARSASLDAAKSIIDFTATNSQLLTRSPQRHARAPSEALRGRAPLRS